MPKFAYKDVISILLDRFPEFAETEDFRSGTDHEIPYSVWGVFGHYITDYIRRLPVETIDDDELVARVFDFANELMESGDDDTQTIVVIELFENFYPYRKTFRVARRKLKPQHLTWLERQGDWLRQSKFHYEAELFAPNGLDALAPSLARCSWEPKVTRFDADKDPRLEADGDHIDLTMDATPGPRHAFFGDVWRSESEARQLLEELSGLLTRIDIAHRIELYRTDRADSRLEEFRHRWPDAGQPPA